MDIHPSQASPDPEDSKRKRRAIAQGQRACNPCRLRKVKCSYQTPYSTCVERQHPEICQYDAPLKRVRLDPSPSATMSSSTPSKATAEPTLSEDRWAELLGKIDRLEQGLQAVQAELARREPSTRRFRNNNRGSSTREDRGESGDDETSDEAGLSARDMHAAHPITGETIFLGGNSVPAMAMALSHVDGSDAVQNLLDNSILPIFTLENESATYPFVDLWGLPHASTERIEKLCGLLPTDAECLQYLRHYRDTAHILFPGIINLQQFETEVLRFLVMRTAMLADMGRPPFTDQNVYGRSVHWLGLLFACLASGCQSSSMPRREHRLTSQVYVYCAYECLRIINYLSCPQLDDIQNLLVLGNVISNNMNAGVAWALLGLTSRLAQGMGLHHASPPQTPTEETALRHEIWSRIIWQDSLLSISYDRATITSAITRWHEPHKPRPGGFSYAECMLRLCTIALDVVNSRTTSRSPQEEIVRIQERRQEVLEIDQQACGHLKQLSVCASTKDFLEYWNWRMHRAYVTSELCRPILTKRNRQANEAVENLRAVCIEALTDTVDAFINLSNLTTFARSSWAAVHRSLSSSLLLGILKEPTRSFRVRSTLERFISVMSSIGSISDASEVPAPISRALDALMQLNVTEGGGGATTGESGSSSSDTGEGSPHAQMQRILWGSSWDSSSVF